MTPAVLDSEEETQVGGSSARRGTGRGEVPSSCLQAELAMDSVSDGITELRAGESLFERVFLASACAFDVALIFVCLLSL